jgi:hypothetical protein
MALLTYLAANWLLVLVVVLAVIVLGAAAFFLKNWKLALATIALIATGFAYQNAVTNGIKIEMANEAAAQVKILNERIEALNKVSAADAQRAKDDSQRISELEDKARATPANNSACFDVDTTRRVRGIQ